jgi:hypothetical protein
MSRILRWTVGLLIVGALLIAGLLFLPFRDWLPGGTVADVPTAQVVNGTAFNRLFPAPGPGEALVFTQEKRGFSEARLKQGDATLALLAVSDTITNPTARQKFAATADTLKGWPLVEQGTQASALLVADRFQVKVIGQGVGLEAGRRHELLEAFDLPALATLQPKATARLRGSTRAGARPALPEGRQKPLNPVPQAAPAAEPTLTGAAA